MTKYQWSCDTHGEHCFFMNKTVGPVFTNTKEVLYEGFSLYIL